MAMTAPVQISRLIPRPLQALRQTPCGDLWTRLLSVRPLHRSATAQETAVPRAGATRTSARAAQPASAQSNFPAVNIARAFSEFTGSDTAQRSVASAAPHGGAVVSITALRSSAYPSPGLARAYGHVSPPPPGHDLEAESHLLHHRERGTLSLSEAEVTVVPYAWLMLGSGAPTVCGQLVVVPLTCARARLPRRPLQWLRDTMGVDVWRAIHLSLGMTVPIHPGASASAVLFPNAQGLLQSAAGERSASEAGSFAPSAPRRASRTGQRRFQRNDAGATGWERHRPQVRHAAGIRRR